MMGTHFYDFFRDDDTKITVEYSQSPYDPGISSGPAESCYPPEGGEVEIIKAWLEPGGEDVVLTAAEEESIVDEICQLPIEPDDGYDDWYAERDL